MADMPFLLQYAQKGAGCRIAGRIGQCCLDIRGGGATPGVQDVENLAFAAAQGLHAGFLAIC
jgi:hypothetical protein